MTVVFKLFSLQFGNVCWTCDTPALWI